MHLITLAVFTSAETAHDCCRCAVQVKGALDKKELLVARLKKMNDEFDRGLHTDANGQRSETFQKAYAQVMLDLQAVRSLHTALLTLCNSRTIHDCCCCGNTNVSQLPSSASHVCAAMI